MGGYPDFKLSLLFQDASMAEGQMNNSKRKLAEFGSAIRDASLSAGGHVPVAAEHCSMHPDYPRSRGTIPSAAASDEAPHLNTSRQL